MKLRSNVPAGVQVVVHNGRVTLTGNVGWLHQKEAAERAVRLIRGVRGVFNHITVTPTTSIRDVRRRIVKALHHAADVDAHRVSVDVSGHTATLSGTVGTWLQRESAERAAANAPGIAHVANLISIQPPDLQLADDDDGDGGISLE
jgi:osmotically-inducible protein OsmY